MDINETPRPGMDRTQGTPAPAHGTPEPPKTALDSSLSQVGQETPGAVPPPPSGETPEPEQGAGPAAAKEKKGITENQLNTIRDIKANPEAREAWYARLDAAVKAGEIHVKSTVTTLKTNPEALSLAAASALLKYAPMRNPDDPATSEQVEAATRAHNHMVNAPALAERVKVADPALFEKIQATGAASLTKKEASDLIGHEVAYNQDIANRPATQDQLNAINDTLAKKPELEAKLSKSFLEAREKGTLTHSDTQYFIKKDREGIKDQNAAILGEAVELLKGLSPEDRESVARITLSRIEEKAGKTFKAEAINYVIKHVNNLVDENAQDTDRKAAMEYFLGYENAAALKAAASEPAKV